MEGLLEMLWLSNIKFSWSIYSKIFWGKEKKFLYVDTRALKGFNYFIIFYLLILHTIKSYLM